jgi:preprotein translocase subunit SecB
MKESNFQIINQRLKKLNYAVNESFSSKSIDLKIESQVSVKKDITQNIALVSLKIMIFQDRPIEDVPFQVEIENTGMFKWENTNNEELIDKFLNFNAPAVLLSNIRSLLSQITAFSGYPPLILPLYDFTK